MKTLSPGSVIGILGGGQLGRMTAIAAARLGYKCHIFCPEDDEPAVEVAAHHTKANFDNRSALESFAKAVDVVTIEWENVPLEALQICSSIRPTHPGKSVLAVAQDRLQEKTISRQMGYGTADFVRVSSAAELKIILDTWALPSILKSTRMGYDGKGQVLIQDKSDIDAAWQKMGSEEGILESFVNFSCEISVIVARREDGVMAVFPVVQNVHRSGILFETKAPAEIDPKITIEAERLAKGLAEKLGVVGLLAVEMFVLKKPDTEGRSVLVNEIAPRPHNSGHWTLDACPVSQFEQLVRAICGLPLGNVHPHSRAVMRNLIGHEITAWADLLKDPSACLHLYGKSEARPGRKMGHVTYLKGAW